MHKNTKVDLVAKKGFESSNGPFPELELVLWSGRVCTKVPVKQDLVQQNVVNPVERSNRCGRKLKVCDWD